MNLYNINKAFQDWLLKVEENEGEVTPELMKEFDEIDGNFETKAEAYAVLIKQLIGESKLLKAEKQLLQERQTRKEKTADKLCERLAGTLKTFGKDKFETSKCKVSFRRSKVVNIIDEKLLPEEYFKIKKEISKKDIKIALDNGQAVAGAEIVEKKNIQIK